jgi:hypothetical protein
MQAEPIQSEALNYHMIKPIPAQRANKVPKRHNHVVPSSWSAFCPAPLHDLLLQQKNALYNDQNRRFRLSSPSWGSYPTPTIVLIDSPDGNTAAVNQLLTSAITFLILVQPRQLVGRPDSTCLCIVILISDTVVSNHLPLNPCLPYFTVLYSARDIFTVA